MKLEKILRKARNTLIGVGLTGSVFKNKFKDNEKIILVSYDEKSKKGQLAKYEIYNPFGELIHTHQEIC